MSVSEEQPMTDAGKAMLQAWARRSWSRFALRLAILDIEREARSQFSPLDPDPLDLPGTPCVHSEPSVPTVTTRLGFLAFGIAVSGLVWLAVLSTIKAWVGC